MTALNKAAREAISNLSKLLTGTRKARAEFAARQPLPRSVRIEIRGSDLIQVLDANTGERLGSRRRYRDAEELARAIERGIPHPMAC